MMLFKYNDKEAYLQWYTQELVTASQNSVYGREILCRGYLRETNKQIPTHKLISYIYSRTSLLLAMTCQQIDDVVQLYHHTAGDQTYWINLSGHLVADDLLFEQLWNRSLSKLNNQQKQAIVLEICEDDISDDVVFHRVSFLKSHNFIIAMDDFGSGHSNLIRLHQIDFDIIKLDLKLLSNVPDNLWLSSYYREIIALCSSKGSMIVAEGVEEIAQAEFVRWAGVDLIQGFYFSTPTQLINTGQYA